MIFMTLSLARSLALAPYVSTPVSYKYLNNRVTERLICMVD